MLQSKWQMKDGRILERPEPDDESVRAAENISRLISAMRRHAGLFAAFCLSGFAVGVLYVLTATPLYTASATIMIDNRQVRAVHDISTLSDPRPSYGPEIEESQIEILRSEKVGMAVINNLNLSPDDPAFTKPTWVDNIWSSVMGKLKALIGKQSEQAPSDADRALNRKLSILRTLNRNLLVKRVGRSFVLQVDYTSPSPARAAEIANAYTNAYILEQLDSSVEATRRAQTWLQKRTEELRQLSVDADFAAQKFKADHNLLATKGALVSEQQLNEMTSQLVTQRAVTAESQARYLRIRNIIDTHQTDSAVTESLANEVMSDLRTKYLNASKRKMELERKLGPAHITVVDLKNTIEDLKTQLFQELGRIAETYRSDYEVAAEREKALAENLARQQTITVTANDAQVRLRQLEQKAESYRALYQSFLQRYHAAAQQENFPLTDAHVISAANRPLAPSHPRKSLVLGISLALGILAGAGVVTLRELTDYVFRTAAQVSAELGVDVLGMLPLVAPASLPEHVPNNVAPMMRYAIDNPFSAFAETLRLTRVAADQALRDRSPKIIGVVSLLPNEGKTTVAKNFASLLALEGAKTLLIDADTRRPVLTQAIGCERREALQSESSALPSVTEILRYEPESGLQILPCIYAKDDPRVAGGLRSITFQALLRSSDRSYDYVVLDLPPIGPAASARDMSSAIDGFIFVVEWGKTSRGAVRAALARERMISEKLLGVILNKVDMKKLFVYEHFGSDGYYYKNYENYHNRARTD